MKRLLPYFLCITLCSVFIVSCQQDDDLSKSDQANYDRYMTFIYNGDAYSSGYYVKDSVYNFSDSKVQEVYDHILQLPELCTYINDNGIPEYYDNYKVYENTPKPRLRGINGRATSWAKLTIYEYVNYAGWNWGFFLDDNVHRIEIPDLDGYFGGNMHMGGKTSSFQLETYYREYTGTAPNLGHGDYTEVTFFDKTGLSGRSFVWTKGNPFNDKIYVPSLVYYNWPVGTPASMDNSIRSLLFRYTY